ncbi:MAG TPA: hypothetical protein VFE36_00625 [Candidatus Baltobacteraceae bacterium]|nr:hypothetical protein [Candidatus Baltobacteraceae bacterium]
MRNNVVAFTVAFAATIVFALASAAPASAIPIFAQRYRLHCTACHSVMPELNAFGVYFRTHGYRLPLPKHGTTMLAIRYQMSYAEDPAPGSRRWTPGGIVLGNADVGKISLFIHYSLGAAGGPSGLYLGFLTDYNQQTNSSYRFGLFELPLAQSPGERLDDLAPYGYYTAHAGLNDLPLASPRWGEWTERQIGNLRADFTFAVSEFKGAAYGGKPIATGETTSPAIPELGLWLNQTVVQHKNVEFDFGGQMLNGSRSILLTGGKPFDDPYQRYGLLAHASLWKFDLQAEQWWGNDHNSDGSGTLLHTSGGYARLKIYPIDHAYLGVRYDAQANPAVTRDFTYYAAGMIGPVRLLVQEVAPIGDPGQKPSLGGAMTIAFPGPWKY